MNEQVERRIREAIQNGSERLLLFHGRRRFIAPSAEEVRVYGPHATGKELLEVLEQLSKPSLPREGSGSRKDSLVAWQRELTRFWDFAFVIEEALDEDTFLRRASFSPHLRRVLELSLCRNNVLGLKLLGIATQMPSIKKAASRRAWGDAGFYDIYEWLRNSHPDASLRQEDAIATVSYFATYVIRIIEDYSYLGELGAAKHCLIALKHGAVPLTYEKKTRTVTITDWNTL